MRPIHVVVLLLAGALGGALIMMVTRPLKRVAHDAVVTAATPAPAPAPAAEPEPPKPSPMPLPIAPAMRREVHEPRPIHVAVAVGSPAPEPTAPTLPPPPAIPEPEHAAPAPPQESAAPRPQPHQATLNAGLLLPVRLVDGLSSERNAPGDAFAATLDKELVADGFVIAERGARVEGRVVAVDRSKTRAGALAVELNRLHTSDGQSVPIKTDDYFKHAGGDAELSSETLVTFKLKTPVPLTERVQ